jgi:hypothetical protein
MQPNLGRVSSWPRKIYLLFWLSLISLTGLAAFLVPRILDSSQEQGYREIDGQGRPPLVQPLTGSVATRFPVRPFTDASPAGPEREAFPGQQPTPSAQPTRVSGLPQRDVMGSGQAPDASSPQPVTSRAKVIAQSSVYESPRTTARVLGTVEAGTQVRWLRAGEPGWEEILLRDGRTVYMQSSALNVGGNSEPVPVERPSAGAGEDSTLLALLPDTVDSFLMTLRDGDLLRAGTYLTPEAPPLEEPDLGAWTALIGPQADAQVGRIEPVSGRGAEWRSVLVLDQTNGVHVQTTWQWSASQERWLLTGWE